MIGSFATRARRSCSSSSTPAPIAISEPILRRAGARTDPRMAAAERGRHRPARPLLPGPDHDATIAADLATQTTRTEDPKGDWPCTTTSNDFHDPPPGRGYCWRRTCRSGCGSDDTSDDSTMTPRRRPTGRADDTTTTPPTTQWPNDPRKTDDAAAGAGPAPNPVRASTASTIKIGSTQPPSGAGDGGRSVPLPVSRPRPRSSTTPQHGRRMIESSCSTTASRRPPRRRRSRALGDEEEVFAG